MNYNIVHYTSKKNFVQKINFEKVIDDCTTFTFENENYNFQLILIYPSNQEFLNEQDLKRKIANFYNNVLKVNNHALLFKIDSVGIGRQQVQFNQPYLISFKGIVSGEHLETKLTTIVDLLIILLESYFICIQGEQLKPIYFELNEQVVIDLLSGSQDSIKWNFFTLGDVAGTVINNDVVGALTEDIMSTEVFSSLTEVVEVVVEPVLNVAEFIFVETISFVFSLFI